jgi:hypothetical protein
MAIARHNIASSRVMPLLGIMLAVHLSQPPQAAAYVDPISGSIVLQVIVAGALGAFVGLKRSWGGVTAFCRRMLGRARE